MAQAFAEQGASVTVVVPADDPEVRGVDPAELLGFEPAFSHLALSSRVHRGQSYLHAVRILRLARRLDIDLIVSRSARACLLPARAGIPTVLEVHTMNVVEGPQDGRVLRWLLDSAGLRGVVAISAGLADDLFERAGVPRDRILVAHDGVRPAVIEGDPPRVVGPEGTEDAFHVGYTGSLYGGRGVESLLRIARSSPWMVLHLVGGPPAVAAELADRLDRDADATNVVVHGMQSPARTREMQRGFDALVAPFGQRVLTDSGIDSSRWMSPMKIFEYMDSGRPIVTSDLPVLREVLRPDVDALMVPPDDEDALAGALARLAADAGLRARLAASARHRVSEHFTWDRRAREILRRFGPPSTDGPQGPAG